MAWSLFQSSSIPINWVGGPWSISAKLSVHWFCILYNFCSINIMLSNRKTKHSKLSQSEYSAYLFPGTFQDNGGCVRMYVSVCVCVCVCVCLWPCLQLFRRFHLSLTVCTRLPLCRDPSMNTWLSLTACTCRYRLHVGALCLTLLDSHLCT